MSLNIVSGSSLTNLATTCWVQNNSTPMMNAISMNSISSLGLDSRKVAENPLIFNNQLDYPLPITNQRSSGRCWLFASCNLIRMIAFNNLEKEYGKIENFEFSQTYLYFWDKLERYHRNLRYYLDIKSKNKNTDRYLFQLYQDPMGDGGQWDMAKEIVKKYGMVPKQVYPDTHHSKSSREMNGILTSQLKSDFKTLDTTDPSVVDMVITVMMQKVYTMLSSFLGTPPTQFDWTFKAKDGNIHRMKNTTPLQFLEKTGFKPDEWVSIINDPRQENKYNDFYMVNYLGNVHDKHVGWINMNMSRVKELTKLSIDGKMPVWFGCDVSSHRDKSSGVEDIDIIDYSIVGMNTSNMDKESRLKTFSSLPNHAMLITGYHSEDNEIKRWKVENSWGKSSGTEGYLIMTDKWMEEYVFQILINKSLLTKEELLVLEKDAIAIEPWDPLGTLA